MLRPPSVLRVVALVVTAAAGVSVIGVASPAAAVTSITVKAGYDDTVVPGRAFPARVTVQPDRLVHGTLVVRAAGGGGGPAVEVHLPVEIPGGSAKEFVVVVPSSTDDPGGPARRITARVLDGGTEVARSPEVPLRVAPAELVGLLPGVLRGAPPPGAAPLAVDAGVARFVAVGPAELAQAPASLEPLGTLGMAEGELAQLAPTSKAGVLRWVAAGGQLLVDSSPGAHVDGLPDEWQPGENGRARAGEGQVVATSGAMAGGRWTGLVEPTRSVGSFGGRGSVGQALANDAGLRIPQIGWLLLFLVAYVVVVGPMTAFVLSRMRRPELAWVVIPLAAVVFTAGSWAGARGLRGSTRLAHGTVVEMTPVGWRATTFVGLAARTRQETGVGFAEGWTAERARFGFDPAADVVEATPDGTVARLRLDAGQFDVVRGGGPVDGAEGIVVDATSEVNGVARGVVRNRLPYRLEEVIVLVAAGGTLVGPLDPGEERSWEVRPGALRVDPHEPGGVERSLWRQRFEDDHDSVVNLPVWHASPAGGSSFGRGPGEAVAVGWTRGFTPPVVVGGDRRKPVGRTAVVARAPVRPGGGMVTDLAIRRDILRSGNFEGGRRVVDEGPFSLIRFTLPPGAEGRPLVARLPVAGNASSVWVDGRWQPLEGPGVAGGARVRRPGFGPAPVPVPDGPVATLPPPPAPVAPARPGGAASDAGPSTTFVPPRGLPPGAASAQGSSSTDELAGQAQGFGPGIATADVDIPAAAVQRGVVWLRTHDNGLLSATSDGYTLRERA